MPRPENIFFAVFVFFWGKYGIIAGMVASAALAVEDIPASAAPLVRKARRKPVALSQNGGKTVAAYLVSARVYREMTEAAEMAEGMEDRYWAKEADNAMKEGTVGAEASRKFIAEMKGKIAAHKKQRRNGK